MPYVDKSFSNASGNGSDFTICTLYGLPSIPAGAILDSLVLSFNAYRSGGGSNAEVFVTCAGHKLRLYEDFPKKETKSLSINFCDTYSMNLVNNNNGVLTFTDGSTSVGIRGYHDYWLFGASDWTISSINIRANYTIPNYTITVNVNDTNGGTVIGGGTYASGSTATLTATPNPGWKFKCWQDTTSNTNPTRTVTVTGNATYIAVFEKLTYRVRWFNEDGTLLETDSAVPYGDAPSYNGATPTKAGTASHYYVFIGWNIDTTTQGTTPLTAVVSNIDYYARFEAVPNKYTITWQNYDGTLLDTDTVEHGAQPDYIGDTPTRASTAQYHYTFLGWSADVDDEPREDTELEDVTGNIVYTAVYLPVIRRYQVNVTLPNENEGTLEGIVSGEYEYGTQFKIKVKAKYGYKIEALRISQGDNYESDMKPYFGDYTDNGDYDEDYTEGSITLSIPVLDSFSVYPFLVEQDKGVIYVDAIGSSKYFTITGLNYFDEFGKDGYNEFYVGDEVTLTITPKDGIAPYIRITADEGDCMDWVQSDYKYGSSPLTKTIKVIGKGVANIYIWAYSYNGIQIGTEYSYYVPHYDEQTKTVYFLIDGETGINPIGADTVDGLHFAVMDVDKFYEDERLPYEARRIQSIQIGTTYVYVF